MKKYSKQKIINKKNHKINSQFYLVCLNLCIVVVLRQFCVLFNFLDFYIVVLLPSRCYQYCCRWYACSGLLKLIKAYSTISFNVYKIVLIC